jgi:hypothetical protein
LSQASSKTQVSSTRLIVGFCIGWAIFSILFFLLFGVRAPGEEEHPGWFLIGINLLEITAFALATVLCFRNAGSGQIISGRGVWLPIAIAMLAYTLGNILFALWGTVFGLDPAVSLGDVFYLMSYIFLFIGLFQAVLPRRIDLSFLQWLLIAGIGLLGVGLAYFLNYQVAVAAEYPIDLDATLSPPAAQITLVQAPSTASTPTDVPTDVAPAVPEAAEEPISSTAPAWAIAIDGLFEPYEGIVGLLYVVGDCLLVVIAATLLVAFWGGRFSQSWKLIAVAAFFLYVADMFFAFDLSQDAYIEGAFWEVFWNLSALFFALGAAVEYEISTQSRRGSRRRG